TQAGLRMSDLSRLKRVWDRRMEKEPVLRKRMGELRAQVEKDGRRDLAAIAVEPAKLRRSRASTAKQKAVAESAQEVARVAAAVELPLDQYAVLMAELAERPAAEREIRHRFGLSQVALQATQHLWTERFKADRQAQLDFNRLFAHQRGRL